MCNLHSPLYGTKSFLGGVGFFTTQRASPYFLPGKKLIFIGQFNPSFIFISAGSILGLPI